jgi:hypothetical protein
MRVGRQDLVAESNISDVGSVPIDNQSIESSLSSLVEESTAHSSKEKLVTTTHTERFD